MGAKINKYDYLSGALLGSYDSIKEASIDNNIGYMTIYKELQKDKLEYPRRDFYFGYDPKPHYVIECYDNEYLDLLAIYKNIKEASKGTGVIPQVIQYNTSKNLPLRERKCGSTGLWFVKKLIMT